MSCGFFWDYPPRITIEGRDCHGGKCNAWVKTSNYFWVSTSYTNVCTRAIIGKGMCLNEWTVNKPFERLASSPSSQGLFVFCKKEGCMHVTFVCSLEIFCVSSNNSPNSPPEPVPQKRGLMPKLETFFVWKNQRFERLITPCSLTIRTAIGLATKWLFQA